MKDKIVRGITNNKQIRFFAVQATNTVTKAETLHNLSTTNTVLLGRMIASAAMMASDLKADSDNLTLKIDANGPCGNVVVTANKNGDVKAYIRNPQTEFSLTENKQFNLSAALGEGYLLIIKDVGMKNPYVGQVELRYKTIAQDLTYYFVQSEQLPSSVGLGVLVFPGGKVRQAGGFIVQLMPDACGETISKLEENLRKFPNYTDIMDMGYNSQQIIENFILKGFQPVVKEIHEVRYKCDCSKHKFSKGIKMLENSELEDMIIKNEPIKVSCHFCNTTYEFTPEEIQKILAEKNNS
ncbi:MAG: Hsp33 family molecular chaperone HslO [Candidatus Cloacimonadota bacterium]|nr:Hsp33 family molecular chaperone HslO [Candidatus Cloacimonadota bacterium]